MLPHTIRARWLPVLFVARAAALADVIAYIVRNGGGSIVDMKTHDGVRGLVTTGAADTGSVLLEVPLACCLSDFGGEDTETVKPPDYARDQPWDVQLSCSVLAAHHAHELALVSSWPKAPVLAMSGSEEEWALACDIELESDLRESRNRCNTAFVQLQDATTEFSASADEFRDAMALVWSRALRIRAPRPVGTRRLLVPGLDLANHAEAPSAFYSYSPTRGGMLRLHAARRLNAGDPVTIKYADAGSEHFAALYGFVPAHNRQNAVILPLGRILEAAGSLITTTDHPHINSDERVALRASAPDERLLALLRSLLSTSTPAKPTGAGRAGVEPVWNDWQGDMGGMGGSPGSPEDDALYARALRLVGRAAMAEAEQLSAAGTAADTRTPSPGACGQLLITLRRSRITLLSTLSNSMCKLAERFEAGGGSAAAARTLLEVAIMEAEAAPFPVARRELDRWDKQEWDWDEKCYRDAT